LIAWQARPLISAAMSVVPDPENGSYRRALHLTQKILFAGRAT